MLRNRWFRLGATIAVTGLAAAYIVSKIDVGKTAHIIGSASLWWLLLCLVLFPLKFLDMPFIGRRAMLVLAPTMVSVVQNTARGSS